MRGRSVKPVNGQIGIEIGPGRVTLSHLSGNQVDEIILESDRHRVDQDNPGHVGPALGEEPSGMDAVAVRHQQERPWHPQCLKAKRPGRSPARRECDPE